tara:strand:+ start:115 stop:225 length:111 start_codon:yes stop_codon:yes gene_type:complete
MGDIVSIKNHKKKYHPSGKIPVGFVLIVIYQKNSLK